MDLNLEPLPQIFLRIMYLWSITLDQDLVSVSVQLGCVVHLLLDDFPVI